MILASLSTAPGELERNKEPIVPRVPHSKPIKASASLEKS